jgi:putative ABC transport system substrate-binding protein
LALAGGLVGAVTATVGPRRRARVGYLSPGKVPPASTQDPFERFLRAHIEAFTAAMARLGWIEGRDYVLDLREAAGRGERYADLAKELVALRPDVLMSVQTPGIRALMQATQTIPIVMIAPGDPVGSGLVADLAHPGANVTGLSFDVDLATYLKQVEFLKEIIPRLTSFGVVSNPVARVQPVEPVSAAIGSSLGLRVVPAEVSEAGQLEPAFIELKKQGAAAALVIADGFLIVNAKRLAELGVKHGVALGSQWQGYPVAGALMSYSSDIIDNYARAAWYVDRILHGARPAELPVQRPSKLALVINDRTARALGLSIPRSILLRASTVIE